jgi:hypothetical protein
MFKKRGNSISSTKSAYPYSNLSLFELLNGNNDQQAFAACEIRKSDYNPFNHRVSDSTLLDHYRSKLQEKITFMEA